MAQDYSEYLAVQVLNERQQVSFRSLSRALKVHSNLAKQMLYDFHQRQNSRKPGSVHATYLITGTKVRQRANGTLPKDGEDSIMEDGLPSSSVPGPEEDDIDDNPVRSITLVREEHLQQAKAAFEHVTGMHIYSLHSQGLSDMQTLTECNRHIAASYASEDPLTAWKQYGTIQNPYVRRRTGKTAPPPPAAPVKPKVEPKIKSETSINKTSASTKAPSESKSSAQEAKTATSKTASSKPANFKREDSNLFKSFAKAGNKPKKSTETDSSAAATPEPASQDAAMTGFSDDDDDADDADSELPEELQNVHVPGGKSRKERAAELEAMMDREDETMTDAEPAADAAKQDGDGDGDHKADDDDDAHDLATSPKSTDEDAGAIDRAPAAQQATTTENTVTVENGRRRGRRRVMKKKTVKDEEGYLVTREEPAWESFSEDEPAPKKPKVEVPAGSKAAKKGTKVGQGNIMSFFGKK